MAEMDAGLFGDRQTVVFDTMELSAQPPLSDDRYPRSTAKKQGYITTASCQVDSNVQRRYRRCSKSQSRGSRVFEGAHSGGILLLALEPGRIACCWL